MAMFQLTMKLMAVMEHGQKSDRFSLRLEGLVPFSFGKEGFYNVSLQKMRYVCQTPHAYSKRVQEHS